jgi:hypothetical protein
MSRKFRVLANTSSPRPLIGAYTMNDEPVARVQRIMPAAPEVVFDQWLDPESLAALSGLTAGTTVEVVGRDGPPSGMLLRRRHNWTWIELRRPSSVCPSTSDVASSVGDLSSWRSAYSRRLA